MKKNLVIFFLGRQLAEFFGIIFCSLWNLISNFGSLIEKKSQWNKYLFILFIYQLIKLVYKLCQKTWNTPDILQVYNKLQYPS